MLSSIAYLLEASFHIYIYDVIHLQEHVDIKAYASDGSYYWFSTQLKMASDRTKV